MDNIYQERVTLYYINLADACYGKGLKIARGCMSCKQLGVMCVAKGCDTVGFKPQSPIPKACVLCTVQETSFQNFILIVIFKIQYNMHLAYHLAKIYL